MLQPTSIPLCAICSDPVDPDVAHWHHLPGCIDANGVRAADCACDLLVHPECVMTDATPRHGQPFGPVVDTYSRAQALSDGVLIDITSMSQEAGWRWPAAITGGAWDRCVAWPTTDDRQTEDGRLWDVVWAARGAVLRTRDGGAGSRLPFTIYVFVPGGGAVIPVRLQVHAGSGDDGQPVVTIMLSDEG